MRRLAVLAIFLGCGASDVALAASPQGRPVVAKALAQAVFATPARSVGVEPIGRLLDRDAFAPDAGLYATRTDQAFLPGSPFDVLRIREQRLIGPGELPLSRRAEVDPRAYEVTLVRQWPALSFDDGDLALDISPHAGFGVIGGDRAGGGSAEAGATVRLSRSELAAQRLRDLGVRDGAAFGDRGRWYLFAAASGRAVGLNMLKDDTGWSRAGWSTDPASRLVGDTQVGLGWRRGAMQTSLGFVHRSVKGEHLLRGIDPKSDSMIAFSLAVRPGK